MASPERRARRVEPGAPVPGSACRQRGTARKETRVLLEQIELAGGTVEPCRNRSGHWKVFFQGRYIGGLSGTPSDHRGTRNDIARLRRAGLPLTSKGRYDNDGTA